MKLKSRGICFFIKWRTRIHIAHPLDGFSSPLCKDGAEIPGNRLGTEYENEEEICKKCRKQYVKPPDTHYFTGGADYSRGSHCMGGYGGRITNEI